MTPVGAAVTFIIVWWLFFFMALPFGVTPDEAPQAGNVESAPARPYLLRKVLAATVLALAATWGIDWLMQTGLIDFRPH